ncbi:MAG: hypothetical protein J1F24_05685 [Oscillospiraceae bacterium]|nr:hypothetical protein [Oscillospiraceae bacterium]
MRKFLAIVLALSLAFAMSTVSFAAITENEGSEDAKVEVIINKDVLDDKYDDPTDVDPDDATYKVDIDASGAVFTYTLTAADYDTETHQYNKGTWTDSYVVDSVSTADDLKGAIIVTNHSNTSLDVTAEWKNAGDDANETVAALTAKSYGVTATLAEGSFSLASAVNTADGVAHALDVTIDGAVPTTLENYTLDYVTITIAGK